MMDNRTRVIRKSSYGRTQLFLPESGAVFREIKCMGGIVRRDGTSVYHTVPDARTAEGAACWHCCEPIADPASAVPLPRVYDATEDVYHVYGRTCSPSCAKAYVLEHTTFDRGNHLNTLMRMLRDLYGVRGPVVETPPRAALKRFGGTFDPRGATKASCRLVEPPFVSYCMIVEEHVAAPAAPAAELEPTVDMEEDALAEPAPPALFDAFLERTAAAPPKAAPSQKRGRATGPMSKFCT